MVIHVFLKNKLISLDSIIPFCVQLNKKCGARFDFIIFDIESYRSIVNHNVVLIDAINNIGKIRCLGRRGKKFKRLSQMRAILSISRIFLSTLMRNEYLLHFGLLDTPPLRKLFKYIPIRKIILSESNANGRYEHELQQNIERSDNVDYYQFRSYNKLIKEKQIKRRFRAGLLLGFDNEWNYFYHLEAKKIKKIIYKTPKKSSEWIAFIKNNSAKYIRLELNKEKILNENSKIIAFFLGHIGHHDADNTTYFKINFVETLTVLSEICPNNTIFIKPHVYANINLINEYILEVEKNIKKPVNCLITKLHPMVLSLYAQFAIFNNDSSLIKDMQDAHVPVVQYLRAFPDLKIENQFASEYSDYMVRDQLKDIYAIIEDISIKDTREYSNRLHDNLNYNFNCSDFLLTCEK